MRELIGFAVWVASAVIGGVVIYLKQGRYLTEEQPVAFFICGPITLVMAVLCPSRWFTSREKAEGKSDE